MSDFLQKDVGIAGFLLLFVVISIPIGIVVYWKEERKQQLLEDPYAHARQVTVGDVKKICASNRCVYELTFIGGGKVTTGSRHPISSGDSVWIAARCSILNRTGPCPIRVLPPK